MIILLGVIVTTFAWTCLYFTIKSRFDKQPEWSCRLVTVCHASTVTVLSTVACATGPWPFSDPGGPNTNMQNLALTVSLGYFLFDSVWCIYHQTEGLTMLIHHAVSVIAISWVLVKGVSGTEAVAGICGFEFTNPLLQARWFLRTAGYRSSVIFIIVEIIFMISFFIMRIVLGSYLLFKIVSNPKPAYGAKILATAFYALSWVFMIYIFRYFASKYFKNVEGRELNEEINKVPSGKALTIETIEAKQK